MSRRKPCPVYPLADAALDSARALAASLRRLRAQMQRCRTCDLLDSCAARRDFNQQLQSALEEVAAEWEISL